MDKTITIIIVAISIDMIDSLYSENIYSIIYIVIVLCSDDPIHL